MKCEDCGKKEGIITFSYEPLSSITRGYGSVKICRACYIKRIEDELERIKDNLKEEKKLLKKEKER